MHQAAASRVEFAPHGGPNRTGPSWPRGICKECQDAKCKIVREDALGYWQEHGSRRKGPPAILGHDYSGGVNVPRFQCTGNSKEPHIIRTMPKFHGSRKQKRPHNAYVGMAVLEFQRSRAQGAAQNLGVIIPKLQSGSKQKGSHIVLRYDHNMPTALFMDVPVLRWVLKFLHDPEYPISWELWHESIQRSCRIF